MNTLKSPPNRLPLFAAWSRRGAQLARLEAPVAAKQGLARTLASWLGVALAVAIPNMSYAACPTAAEVAACGSCGSVAYADLTACVSDIQALVAPLPATGTGCPADPSACGAEAQTMLYTLANQNATIASLTQQLADKTTATTTQIKNLNKQLSNANKLIQSRQPQLGTGNRVGVRQIVLDPATPTTMYAAVYGYGVYKRVAGGDWRATAGLPIYTDATGNYYPDRYVSALAMKGSSTLFAGTYGYGVYISNDSGSTWAACANTGGGMTNRNLRTLALAGTTLYAGTDGDVFTSTDDCATWTSISSGLPAAQ